MTPDHHAGCPYQQLYIYCLKGRLAPGQRWAPSGFLGNWEEDDYSFLFFRQPAHDAVEALVNAMPELALLDETVMSYEQWQGGRLAPLHIAGFSIVSPWDPVPDSEQLPIVLDPGVVFGNGLHPTTRDCLEAVAMVCAGGKAASALDLGTGTGLLALAAARCGVRRVLAVDFNFLCARTAAENIRRNGLEKRIVSIQGRAEQWAAMDVDLMMANIHYDVMRHLLSLEIVAAKRHVILSGLLRGEAKAVEERLSALPVAIRRRWISDSIWYTFYAECR